MNPLTRLKSTLSTVTSTLQAVRELPEVLVSRLEKQAAEIESLHSYAAQLISERDALDTEVKLLNDTLCDLQTDYSKELVAHKETEREAEDLRAKLARYEAAETWHQVTAGDGELPPVIPVLWRNNHPDFQMGELNYSIQGPCGTYEWRFASSEDVPQ